PGSRSERRGGRALAPTRAGRGAPSPPPGSGSGLRGRDRAYRWRLQVMKSAGSYALHRAPAIGAAEHLLQHGGDDVAAEPPSREVPVETPALFPRVRSTTLAGPERPPRPLRRDLSCEVELRCALIGQRSLHDALGEVGRDASFSQLIDESPHAARPAPQAVADERGGERLVVHEPALGQVRDALLDHVIGERLAAQPPTQLGGGPRPVGQEVERHLPGLPELVLAFEIPEEGLAHLSSDVQPFRVRDLRCQPAAELAIDEEVETLGAAFLGRQCRDTQRSASLSVARPGVGAARGIGSTRRRNRPYRGPGPRGIAQPSIRVLYRCGERTCRGADPLDRPPHLRHVPRLEDRTDDAGDPALFIGMIWSLDASVESSPPHSCWECSWPRWRRRRSGPP